MEAIKSIPTPALGINGLKHCFHYICAVKIVYSNARFGHKWIETAIIAKVQVKTALFQRPFWA